MINLLTCKKSFSEQNIYNYKVVKINYIISKPKRVFNWETEIGLKKFLITNHIFILKIDKMKLVDLKVMKFKQNILFHLMILKKV
jgi:hypothetical protein